MTSTGGDAGGGGGGAFTSTGFAGANFRTKSNSSGVAPAWVSSF